MEKVIDEINLYENQILMEKNNINRNAANMGLFTIGTIYTLINLNNSENSTETILNASMLLSFGIGYISSSIDTMKAVLRKELLEKDLNNKINQNTKKLILKKEIDK